MSDTGRKNVTDQVSEKVTPDSQKSYTEQASESVSGTADKVAGSLQPGDNKSTTQKLSDTTRSHGDSAQDQGKDLSNQASGTASDLTKNLSDTTSNLYDQASQKTAELTGNEGSGKTLYEQASEAAQGALNTVSKYAQDAANSISGSGETK